MVKKINAAQFENEAMKSAAAVVDFSATWCGPCRMLAPVLEEISGKLDGRADFYNVDVDEAPGLAARYGVMNIPCVLVLKGGAEKARKVGFEPAPKMAAWIEANL